MDWKKNKVAFEYQTGLKIQANVYVKCGLYIHVTRYGILCLLFKKSHCFSHVGSCKNIAIRRRSVFRSTFLKSWKTGIS